MAQSAPSSCYDYCGCKRKHNSAAHLDCAVPQSLRNRSLVKKFHCIHSANAVTAPDSNTPSVPLCGSAITPPEANTGPSTINPNLQDVPLAAAPQDANLPIKGANCHGLDDQSHLVQPPLQIPNVQRTCQGSNNVAISAESYSAVDQNSNIPLPRPLQVRRAQADAATDNLGQPAGKRSRRGSRNPLEAQVISFWKA